MMMDNEDDGMAEIVLTEFSHRGMTYKVVTCRSDRHTRVRMLRKVTGGAEECWDYWQVVWMD